MTIHLTPTDHPLNATGALVTAVALPPGVGLVTHSLFCGKDCGLTLTPANDLRSTGESNNG
jgi:hypothetical protein